MIDLILKGGIFIYPIILCSVIALAIFIERLWVLRRSHVIPADFIRHTEELLKKQKISDATFLCQGDGSS
ncbi:MAG: MotA/TolQ/ExbB proton channel family protein, partial [Pseudomonadota bacterium]